MKSQHNKKTPRKQVVTDINSWQISLSASTAVVKHTAVIKHNNTCRMFHLKLWWCNFEYDAVADEL